MISPPGAVYMKRGVSKPAAYSEISNPCGTLSWASPGLPTTFGKLLTDGVANGAGINCGGSGCLVSGNTIDNNTGAPMFFSNATSGYERNVLNGNGSGISGGTSMGAKNTNLCNGTAC